MNEKYPENISATIRKHINPFSIENLISKPQDTPTAYNVETKIM